MIPLPATFRSCGYEFNQLAREGDVALLPKTKLINSIPPFEFETFEVVIVHKAREYQWPDGRITPAHENLPSDEKWGAQGWSLQTAERAWQKFNEVKANRVDRAQPQLQTDMFHVLHDVSSATLSVIEYKSPTPGVQGVSLAFHPGGVARSLEENKTAHSKKHCVIKL